MANPVEAWKSEKHGFDVWPDLTRYAEAGTPMKQVDAADLERLKWYGFFYRKRDEPGRYMNRIRITAGEFNAVQAKEMARLAYDCGHGIIDITTRANIQIQGLDIENLPRVTERLTSVGLSAKQTGHDNIRNVFAHPFSGLMSDELIDTRKLSHDITELFLDSREYSDLPRKMNICLNGTSHHSAHFWTQDISYLATHNVAGEVRFCVLIGGTQGQNPQLAWHLPVLLKPDQVVEVTRSILDLFRAQGSREKRNAARFCFLVEKIGVAGVLEWLQQDLPFPLEACLQTPKSASEHDELVGWFRQRDPQLWTMGLSIPLGRMTWQQLEGIGILATKWGDGQLRTTHEQGLAIINISTQFKNAAATDAAALGLSIHADSLDRNTVACTGSQFCNIAVTETKGQMFQLIDKLRKKQVKLEGIRIHMSGCPSSCAQHFTADIGLKGVRVRRLLGTREGYDVYLGGGIAGQVQMGRTFRLGVDVDQLPNLIEEVIGEYYLHHTPGQTFSSYWRDRLPEDNVSKAGDADFRPPVWICEKCQHQHVGIDSPVFCPSCAGLRRYFARVDDEGKAAQTVAAEKPSEAARSDGFVFAIADEAVKEGAGTAVEVAGQELALFRIQGVVHAVDAACPHEGAPLVQGEIKDGVITCPWHGWTFNACTGCSLSPRKNDLKHYETLIENGQVLVRFGSAGFAEVSTARVAPMAVVSAAKTVVQTRRAVAPVEAVLRIAEVIDEAPDVRTFRFDNSAGVIPFVHPGTFAKICAVIDGEEHWRSFTISSSPTNRQWLDLTIKLNRGGVVSRHLFDTARPGVEFSLKGAQGGFYFDKDKHAEPLALISAGSGITPMMSMARFLHAEKITRSCTFIHGARTQADIIFQQECQSLAASSLQMKYHVALSQPDSNWQGLAGRVNLNSVREVLGNLAEYRYFICGPNDFMDALQSGLIELGVTKQRIHTEQFHAAPALVRV